MKYDVRREYVNISGYSPFCHVNEVSPEYRTSPFMLPFVFRGSAKPVHPDTFRDLGLSNDESVGEVEVYPTASFRTVYEPRMNVCYKLPLLRKITRGVRSLPNGELRRSQAASEILSKNRLKGFSFLGEECVYDSDENFNYIVRKMPEGYFPWFYAIASGEFGREFELEAASKIVSSWMHYASLGIFLEYHTQNLLVNEKCEICYRDLSDVRTLNGALRPSYCDALEKESDMLAMIFDRTVCSQNLDHLFRYDRRLGEGDRKSMAELIASEIKELGLAFPNYSLDFPHDRPERTPMKTGLTRWRKQ